jgi:uncharacterized membrane protein YebE (DUF533 family)
MIRSALKTPPPLEECLEGLGAEAGRLALRDATLMAAADGTVDDDEREVLQLIVDHLGLADNSVEKLLDWTVKGAMWMQEGFDLLNTLSE